MPATLPRRWRLLFISLFILSAAAVPAAWIAMPTLMHRHIIGKITSADVAERERGLNYVIRRAAQRPHVLRDAVARLEVKDELNFLQIASALQQAGMWRQPPVPDEAWLRWIGILGRDADPESRILAAQQLADLKAMHGDPRVLDLVTRWLTESSPDVRLNALIVAAEIAGRLPQPNSYDALVVQATADASPLVAREACLLARVLNLPAERCSYPDIPVPTGPEPDALTLETLEDALESPYPFVRDRACIFALTQLDETRQSELIARLLASFSDDGKRSGAILAGLTGLQSTLLRKEMDEEDIWAVQQIHRLGLWMQGKLPELDAQAPLLLARDDLPASTILLALLHHDRRSAFDIILTPRGDELILSPQCLNLPEEEGEAPVTLTRLLSRYHWWDVLRHYLPKDAPGIVLQTDAKTLQYQVDLLRNWWLVHRGRPGKEH